MGKTNRQRWIDTALLQSDGEVLIEVGFTNPVWAQYGRHLEKLVLKHKNFFPNYTEGQTNFDELAKNPDQICDREYTDNWGCKWHTLREWDVGQIMYHPLADLSAFADYTPPDAYEVTDWTGKYNWEEYAASVAAIHERGERSYAVGGRIFERAHFLMGMENMMVAMAEDNPVFTKIMGMVIYFSLSTINNHLMHGKPDEFFFPDDLGDQRSLLISPTAWRKHFKPGYRAMFAAARQAGCIAHLHSDGYNAEVFDDLVEIGLNILNCQALLIGFDRVIEGLRGRMCINADVDRQTVMPYGTPNDVREYVKEMILTLGSPKGGLIVGAGIYPGVPLGNIEAFLDASAEYRNYWVDK